MKICKISHRPNPAHADIWIRPVAFLYLLLLISALFCNKEFFNAKQYRTEQDKGDN